VSTAQWLQLWLDTPLEPGKSTTRSYRQHVRNYLNLGATLLRELTNSRVQQAMFTSIIRTHGAAGTPIALHH
jgi:hypothetical protein